MPKLDIDTIETRLGLYETRLRELVWEADQLPLRFGRSKPQDECPRGHRYPENPVVYPTGRYKTLCRQCETCRRSRAQRMHLRERIKKLKRLRQEYIW